MSKIIAIGTAVPPHKNQQKDILNFMVNAIDADETERRKISMLYYRSGIETRYSVLPDYALPMEDWTFYPKNKALEPFPNIEKRMEEFHKNAVGLSIKAIENFSQTVDYEQVTHLITVSCTGLSAPGLDIQLIQALNLSPTIMRTSVNFMGCYAAIHALKIADVFCKADPSAKVLIVCTELCTLHFQKENKLDFITSGLLFADGSAACLVVGDDDGRRGLTIENFYSKIALQGNTDMAWNISSNGFLMTLSNHIPALIKQEIKSLLDAALKDLKLDKTKIQHWAIHPGGKDILAASEQAIGLRKEDLTISYDILKNYGNMSSATILFVLKEIMQSIDNKAITNNNFIFATAFGPGITMESLILSASKN
jgi:predicted naringenin-chalcone synthase